MERVLLVIGLCACSAAPTGTEVRAPSTVATVEESAPRPEPLPQPEVGEKEEPEEPPLQLTSSGLGIVDVKLGQGAEARPGQHVVVHYVGHLSDGSEFDSSRGRGVPFEFELGSGKVIAGWDEGIEGMRVGGLRKLIIPPAMGYGTRGHPPSIPPDAVLEFVVELLEVR